MKEYEDERPTLGRRKKKNSSDEENSYLSRSARNYRSDDEFGGKKKELTKLSMKNGSLEDLSYKKPSLLDRRNKLNRSRSPSPTGFGRNRRARSRSPSPSRHPAEGREGLYHTPRSTGRLAPLRNTRGLSNDYDSDKEPWQRNKLPSHNKRFDDSDEDTPKMSRKKYGSRFSDEDDAPIRGRSRYDEDPPRVSLTRGRLSSSRGSDDEDDRGSMRSRGSRFSSRKGDDSDSDPPRVSFSSSGFRGKQPSPRPSSPSIGGSSLARRDPFASNYGSELNPLPKRGLAPLAPIAPLQPLSQGLFTQHYFKFEISGHLMLG